MTTGLLRSYDYLVLPRSSSAGYLVEIGEPGPSSRAVVDNMAEISITSGRISVEDSMGGLWTKHALQEVAKGLLSRPMRFEADFNSLLIQAPSEAC